MLAHSVTSSILNWLNQTRGYDQPRYRYLKQLCTSHPTPTRQRSGSPPKQIDAECSGSLSTIMCETQYLQIPTDELMNWGSYTVQFGHCVTYLTQVSLECYSAPFPERVVLHLHTHHYIVSTPTQDFWALGELWGFSPPFLHQRCLRASD